MGEPYLHKEGSPNLTVLKAHSYKDISQGRGIVPIAQLRISPATSVEGRQRQRRFIPVAINYVRFAARSAHGGPVVTCLIGHSRVSGNPGL